MRSKNVEQPKSAQKNSELVPKMWGPEIGEIPCVSRKDVVQNDPRLPQDC
jgi:hypothetical protein